MNAKELRIENLFQQELMILEMLTLKNLHVFRGCLIYTNLYQ